MTNKNSPTLTSNSSQHLPVWRAVLRLLCLLIAVGPEAQSNARTPLPPQQLSAGSKQSQTTLSPLEFGKSVEGELKGGESHSYQITLARDQYLSVAVDQRGINLVVTLTGPDATKLLEADTARGKQGRETLTVIADASGNYRIEMSPAEKDAAIGRYAVKIVELRTPTTEDRALEDARRLSEESRVLKEKGSYDEALPLAERALAIRERVLGLDDAIVAESLNALAVLYDNKSDYEKAEPVNLRALAIREKVLGPDHPDVAKTLNNLAWIYGLRHDYAKAEVFYKRALAIQEQAFGLEHPEVATTLNDLALLYYDKGDYEQSILVNQRVLAIREKALGPDDSGVAKALNNLGLVYEKKAAYEKAEEIYQRALSIWVKALGSDHPEVVFPIDNLARIYFYKGDYAEAEPLFQRALAIREKTLGPDHAYVARSLNNLATLYSRKGDYAHAEPLYLRSLAIWEKRLGPDNASLATPLNNLAKVYENIGNYEKAEPLFQRALAIREKALGPDHADVGESLVNLGQLFLKSRKDDARAESLFQRSLEVLEKALGSGHPVVAVVLSNLAALYERKANDDRAEQFYERALAIREKALGPNHFEVAQSLDSLARLYVRRKDIPKALACLVRSNEVRERNLNHNLPLGSERQKLSYLQLFALDTDNALSFHAQLAPRDPQALEFAFTTLLRRKGRALDATADSTAILRGRSNAQDQILFSQLFDARSQLAAIALKGPDKQNSATFPSQLKQLEDRVDQLEAEVSARSAEFRAFSQPITLAAIRASIPNGATLVEFALYQADAAKIGSQKQSRYAVYLLAPQGPAQWVDLGEAAPIDLAVENWRRALRDPQRTDAKRMARAIDEKIMQPVRAVLGQSQHLLVSADGSLNVIPFAALVDEQNHYLAERFSITYLTSGRDLLRLQVARKSRTDPVVVADPAFGEPATIVPAGDATTTMKPSSIDAAGRAQVDYSQVFFGPLPGVGAEVRALKQLLPEATFLTREKATKTALRNISGPSILHIATHGFFLQDAPSSTSNATAAPSERLGISNKTRIGKWVAWVENPLLRSGLALAGANQGRSGENDGVLTALEATGLDLWGTKLVVLSACDTGLGEVKNGEGVYGLRRALVLAGAESQMMSLWPVSDRSTRDLMIDYYKGLTQGQGRGEALRRAQLQMLRNKAHSHPFYWASFIQSGEWANLEGKR